MRIMCSACSTQRRDAHRARLCFFVFLCDRCGNARKLSEIRSPGSPRSYTPRHLADKILQSKSALEGERKQVTVLFADVKGSMDLAEQVDPEEWHKIMDRFFAILSDGVQIPPRGGVRATAQTHPSTCMERITGESRRRPTFVALDPRAVAGATAGCRCGGGTDRGSESLRGRRCRPR
jgi:hypothetical protein